MENVLIKGWNAIVDGEKAGVKEWKRDLESGGGDDRVVFFHTPIHKLNLIAVEAFDIRADVNPTMPDGVKNF